MGLYKKCECCGSRIRTDEMTYEEVITSERKRLKALFGDKNATVVGGNINGIYCAKINIQGFSFTAQGNESSVRAGKNEIYGIYLEGDEKALCKLAKKLGALND